MSTDRENRYPNRAQPDTKLLAASAKGFLITLAKVLARRNRESLPAVGRFHLSLRRELNSQGIIHEHGQHIVVRGKTGNQLLGLLII